jgi:hypothetical protein
MSSTCAWLVVAAELLACRRCNRSLAFLSSSLSGLRLSFSSECSMRKSSLEVGWWWWCCCCCCWGVSLDPAQRDPGIVQNHARAPYLLTLPSAVLAFPFFSRLLRNLLTPFMAMREWIQDFHEFILSPWRRRIIGVAMAGRCLDTARFYCLFGCRAPCVSEPRNCSGERGFASRTVSPGQEFVVWGTSSGC